MKYKICPSCKENLFIESFWKNPITRDGLQTICKECYNQHKRSIRAERKEKLVKELGGKCGRCGYDKCLNAFDFHHTDDNKESEVSSLLNRTYNKALEEARKCILLCANCHRELHSKISVRPDNIKPRVACEHGTLAMARRCGPPRCKQCKQVKNEYMKPYLKEYRKRKRLGIPLAREAACKAVV